MTTPLSVQLYSLGAAPAADPDGVIARLASLGYSGVEPVIDTGISEATREFARRMGADDLPSVDVPALKRALDEHGLVAHASHVTLPEGAFAEAILDEQEFLGSTHLVAPGLFDPETGAPEDFADLDRIKCVAERFNGAAERARARGMRVGYHNHFWEFATDFDGRSGLEVFYDLVEPDVFAEIDIYWALLGGKDPAELVQALGDRVVLLHVKNGDGTLGTPSTPLAEGVVDVTGVLDAATAATWHVVELEGLSPADIWPALEQSSRYLIGTGRSIGCDR